MKTEYVLGFMFKTDKSAVVLIEKNRPAWQAGKLNGVGGKLEPSEHTVAAMVREFKEETGCDTKPGDWRYFLTLEGGDWRVYCYKAFGEADLRWVTDECPHWFFLFELNEHPIIPNLAWLIPMALDSDRICGAMTYMDEKFMETAKEFVPKP